MKNENEVTALVATIEKCREVSGCPAGVDLQGHLRQLAAENVGLKAAISAVNRTAEECELNGDELKYVVEPSEFEALTDLLDETPSTDAYLAGIKASAIPEGFKLVPEQMYLSVEDIQAICMQCGNGDKKGYGDYEDGILWVGELSNDGEMKYGLNIANANYPEEGSITVFEFDEPLREVAK